MVVWGSRGLHVQYKNSCYYWWVFLWYASILHKPNYHKDRELNVPLKTSRKPCQLPFLKHLKRWKKNFQSSSFKGLCSFQGTKFIILSPKTMSKPTQRTSFSFNSNPLLSFSLTGWYPKKRAHVFLDANESVHFPGVAKLPVLSGEAQTGGPEGICSSH